ncbi:aminopeptidase N [Streptomyces sp. NBC_00554]|uniref:aminopeptidase N n=1 Tax=Streptomyces sp. NBC_00554 TaxID=2903661 RepID=UPI00352EE485|nr:aminopeptidase N [Streptomyces sp. NBC_00554]
MPALTRTEAEARARLLTVHRYTVHLDLTGGDEEFGSRTEIGFTAREGADTFVELKPSTLHRAVLDGRPLDPATLTDGRLPLTLTSGEHTLLIEADMRYSRTGEGLHRFTDPADGETYVHSQAFLDQAQRIFACFDQPDLKAVFDVQAAVPAGWTALGNSVGAEPCKDIWEFEPTPPLSTYLFALAAGPWHSVRTEHANLPFGLHCRRSLAAHLDAAELFEITRRCFDRYAQLFAEPYPFDSYDQIFVPEFNGGAMENPGLVAYKEAFLFRSEPTPYERGYRAKTLAHEMAHMWFGDMVTMRWWDDLWLNESFADLMAYEVTGAWPEFTVHRKTWGYDADQRSSTHPVAPAAVPDTAAALLNFDGISYAKGASALRQLSVWLGESTFRAGVDAHLTRHRFGNASLADLVDTLTEVSGRDVRTWAEAWLRTTGVDTIRAEWAPEGPSGTWPGREPDGVTATGTRVSEGAASVAEPTSERAGGARRGGPGGVAPGCALWGDGSAPEPAPERAGGAREGELGGVAAGGGRVGEGVTSVPEPTPVRAGGARRGGPGGVAPGCALWGDGSSSEPAPECARGACEGEPDGVVPGCPRGRIGSVGTGGLDRVTSVGGRVADGAAFVPERTPGAGAAAGEGEPDGVASGCPRGHIGSARTDGTDADATLAVRSTGARPHRLALGLYDYDDRSRLVLRERILAEPGGTYDLVRRPVLLLPNDGDLTYAKVRLDAGSWAAVTASLSSIEDPGTRAVLWTVARDLVRDGELPPTAYLELVARHLPYESDPVLTESVLGFARTTVADQYVNPGQRPAALAALADVSRALLGTDRHAAALRTLIDSTSADELPDVPEGDLELRWRALLRRCVLGAADEKEIDALEADDRTAAGREGAGRCRAALPGRAAKEAAWRALFGDELPVPLLAATGQGFWQPEQADVTEEFAPRWFDAATALAERRGPAVAAALARHTFPAHTASAAVLGAGERWLERGNPAPALRRGVTDRLDDLRRAVSVRGPGGGAAP